MGHCERLKPLALSLDLRAVCVLGFSSANKRTVLWNCKPGNVKFTRTRGVAPSAVRHLS
jgi:hypothetical protein